MDVSNDTLQQYIIVAVIVIIFAVFFAILAYYYRNTPPPVPATQPCLPGQCPTNIFSGQKTCPPDASTILQFNPAFETCNAPFTCNSDRTPFAVLRDGSTDINGKCD